MLPLPLQVLSSGTGIRRHPLFFLECCGLGGRKKAQPAGSGSGGGSGSGSGSFTPPRASIEMGNTAYDEAAGGKGGSGALKLSPDEREVRYPAVAQTRGMESNIEMLFSLLAYSHT